MTPAVRSLQESLFLGGAMFIVLLVIVGAFLGALVIRWIVKGPPPPPPPWGTTTDDKRDSESNDRGRR
jgi:hypothetical protein